MMPSSARGTPRHVFTTAISFLILLTGLTLSTWTLLGGVFRAHARSQRKVSNQWSQTWLEAHPRKPLGKRKSNKEWSRSSKSRITTVRLRPEGTNMIITAVFRSLGHATFVRRQRRSMITTYLRFDRKRRRLVFFYLLLFLTCLRFCVVSSPHFISQKFTVSSATLPMDISETLLGH